MSDSSDPDTCQNCPMPTEATASAHGMTRRDLMLTAVASAVMLAVGPRPAWAQVQAPASTAERFLGLSRKVTGYDDLNPLTASRIYDALAADGVAALEKLLALADGKGDAKAIQTLAREAGLGDTLTAVVSAWYTGTVTSKAQATVVAYREALMYRPVEDGLTVPTYCNKGPMWWQDTLPPGVTRKPVNNPKVL